MFMGNCKQRALVVASPVSMPAALTRTASGVYIIHGIAVILPTPRLTGGHAQLRNFQRPARSFRFSGFAMAAIWADTYCESLTYAQLGHSNSGYFRLAFMHSVPGDRPKQQSFL